MALPESLRRLADRMEHVRVSVSDVEAARALEDTGEIVLSPAPAATSTPSESVLELLRARGVAVFPV